MGHGRLPTVPGAHAPEHPDEFVVSHHTGQHPVWSPAMVQSQVPGPHHANLETVVRHWLFGLLVRGALVVLMAVGGYMIDATLGRIDDKIEAMNDRLDELNISVRSTDIRVQALDTRTAIHEAYLKTLQDWRLEMNAWRTDHENHRNRKENR